MKRRLQALMNFYGITKKDFKHPIILLSGVDGEQLIIMAKEAGPNGQLKTRSRS